ncbi:MAG: hypothetical protein ACRDZ3_23595 [Acidimicrobiia bacterium]
MTRNRLLGLVAAVAVAAAYLAWGNVEVPDHRVPVTGTVLRQEAAPPGMYHTIVVEYEVDGKQYTTRLPGARNTGPDVESFRPGEEVALLRSEEDPTRVHRPGGPSFGGSNPLPAPLLAVGVLILALALFAPKKMDLSKPRWLRME